MSDRSRDWMRQAGADLRHAENSRPAGDFNWACFAAHQAAEKAVKAAFQRLHADAWGHTVSVLLSQLPKGLGVASSLIDRAKTLDKH